ncbi:ArnT family glycosyltransferase, partial [Streptomyces sp. NPDC090029]
PQDVTHTPDPYTHQPYPQDVTHTPDPYTHQPYPQDVTHTPDPYTHQPYVPDGADHPDPPGSHLDRPLDAGHLSFTDAAPESSDGTMTLQVQTDRGEAPPDSTGYRLHPQPDSGWSARASFRRAWVSRWVLLCLLAVQATLSLRLQNTAFEDEGLYLLAGHINIGRLLHGAPLQGDFETYFSGTPLLYPVLAAWADSRFGLEGARALSLACMLGCTTLLYALTRRLFNERAGLCAAGMFVVAQSTAVLGRLATYDASALFLLALAAWMVVRTASTHWLLTALAAPVASLAVAVKYASALYLPTLVVLAALTAYQRCGAWRALARAVLLAALTASLLAAGLYYSGLLAGIQSTTTARPAGDTPVRQILTDCARWGGLSIAVGCLGAVSYARRGRMSEAPGWHSALPGARWRGLLGLVLVGTALLAPSYQLYLHTHVSLHKHIGFGLFFAAPLAGVGITRLMGAHFKYPQWAIVLGVVMLSTGMSQAYANFHSWPDSTNLVSAMRPYLTPQSRVLADSCEAPAYSMRHEVPFQQWNCTYAIDYTDRTGHHLTGAAGFRAAVADGRFSLVVLDRGNPVGESAVIRAALARSADYRLVSTVPYATSWGGGRFELWARHGKSP